MIRKLRYISATGTVPYANLALEEYLLENTQEDEVILYLWQNRRTVVIGKNQNAWKECRVSALEADGGHLVRRLSGGGAVYHDLGNLNFTFCVHKENYNVQKQLSVILNVVNKLGIRAETSGRNDMTVDGQKFSGNAFYQSGGRCYHHGTILLDVDMESLARYLSVSEEKLASKGVASVKSRVTNLKKYCPALSAERMKEMLIEAFGEVYGLVPERLDEQRLERGRVSELTEKFSSWDWNFGKKLPFEYELSHRYRWGEITIQLQMDQGKVQRAAAYSDAMDAAFIEAIPPVLVGCIFSPAVLASQVNRLICEDDTQREMARDLAGLFLNQNNSGGQQ